MYLDINFKIEEKDILGALDYIKNSLRNPQTRELFTWAFAKGFDFGQNLATEAESKLNEETLFEAKALDRYDYPRTVYVDKVDENNNCDLIKHFEADGILYKNSEYFDLESFISDIRTKFCDGIYKDSIFRITMVYNNGQSIKKTSIPSGGTDESTPKPE